MTGVIAGIVLESWMSRNLASNASNPLLWGTLLCGIVIGIAIRALTEKNP